MKSLRLIIGTIVAPHALGVGTARPSSAAELERPVILAISGSLRRNSLNSAALRAAARAAASAGVIVELDDSVRNLPPFDPDLEPSPPAAVLRLRRAVDDADGVLLAVPEYTFGIPGALKNTLDWLVRSGSLYGKPLALLHIAARGRGARVRESLTYVLEAHGAAVTHHRVPIASSDVDPGGALSDARLGAALRAVVVDLAVRASGPRAAAPALGEHSAPAEPDHPHRDPFLPATRP